MNKQSIYMAITNTIAWIRRNRKINVENNGIVKINIGSGLTVKEGWINIDANFNLLFAKAPIFVLKFIYNNTGVKNWYSFDHYIHVLKDCKFIHHKLDYGIPLKDNTVDYVYSSHFFEHVYQYQVEFLLNECFRVMKKGSIIRVVLPDLAYAIKLYNNGEKEKGLSLFFQNEAFDDFSRHKYLYDFDLFKEKLLKAGFKNVVQCNSRQGRTPDIDFLDYRDEDSFFTEAEK